MRYRATVVVERSLIDTAHPRRARTWLLTLSGAHARGRRDHDGPAHARASGRCRGLRDPNVPRAIPSLRDSGRSADVSSMPLQTEDVPNVPGPICNGDPPASNILRSIRNLVLEAVLHLRKRSPVAGFRCTRKSALNSVR